MGGRKGEEELAKGRLEKVASREVGVGGQAKKRGKGGGGDGNGRGRG